MSFYLVFFYLHILCRIFWFFNIVAGLVLMVLFIRPIFLKWQTNPTIVSPQSTNYPIWNIYFPAITICSNNKVVQGQLKRVAKKEPWVHLANLSQYEYDFEFDLNEGLKNAISNTILYEVEPHRIKNGSLNATDEYLLNNYNEDIPKAMQQVSTVF